MAANYIVLKKICHGDSCYPSYLSKVRISPKMMIRLLQLLLITSYKTWLAHDISSKVGERQWHDVFVCTSLLFF